MTAPDTQTPRTDDISTRFALLRGYVALGDHSSCMTAIDELEGRVEELERDALRYRYWREHHGWSGYFDDGASNSEDNDDIDTAIDAHLPEHG